mmetsp:Transcript_4511/g.11127  ORF Transcript_4511/g.11127 Transcript_4511/m.11127 type:complete len:206 (+) Transcript_4511:224-841(+)
MRRSCCTGGVGPPPKVYSRCPPAATPCSSSHTRTARAWHTRRTWGDSRQGCTSRWETTHCRRCSWHHTETATPRMTPPSSHRPTDPPTRVRTTRSIHPTRMDTGIITSIIEGGKSRKRTTRGRARCCHGLGSERRTGIPHRALTTRAGRCPPRTPTGRCTPRRRRRGTTHCLRLGRTDLDLPEPHGLLESPETGGVHLAAIFQQR